MKRFLLISLLLASCQQRTPEPKTIQVKLYPLPYAMEEPGDAGS